MKDKRNWWKKNDVNYILCKLSVDRLSRLCRELEIYFIYVCAQKNSIQYARIEIMTCLHIARINCLVPLLSR